MTWLLLPQVARCHTTSTQHLSKPPKHENLEPESQLCEFAKVQITAETVLGTNRLISKSTGIFLYLCSGQSAVVVSARLLLPSLHPDRPAFSLHTAH